MQREIPEVSDVGDNGSSSRVQKELHAPVQIRSGVLWSILFLMVLYTMYFAASLLAPIATAFLLAMVFSPLVRVMVRLRVPQTLSALLVMLTVTGLLTAGIYAVAEPAINWMERAPIELQKLEYKLSWVKGSIANLEAAGKQVDAITRVGEDGDALRQRNARASFSLVDSLLQGAPNVVFGVAVTLILLFFVLASGDRLLNKAVQLAPSLADKRRVIETGRGVQQNVSRYLATITVINAVLGTLVALTMYLLNMPNPMLWGVMVGVLNFIPYIGVLVSMIVVTFVSLLTFETALEVLLPPAAIFGLNIIEGQFLTPILAGRRLALSPVAVFLSLVVMGWIWGVIGVLIAVPLLATVKLVCEEVEPLRPLATFLGDG
jgi:predicted PurR-regulated permease PerM